MSETMDPKILETLDNLRTDSVTEAMPTGGQNRGFIANASLLWANRRFVAKSFLIGLMLSVVAALLWPKTWQSTARLMPPDQTGNSGIAAALMSRAGEALGGLQPSIAS